MDFPHSPNCCITVFSCGEITRVCYIETNHKYMNKTFILFMTILDCGIPELWVLCFFNVILRPKFIITFLLSLWNYLPSIPTLFCTVNTKISAVYILFIDTFPLKWPCCFIWLRGLLCGAESLKYVKFRLFCGGAVVRGIRQDNLILLLTCRGTAGGLVGGRGGGRATTHLPHIQFALFFVFLN